MATRYCEIVLGLLEKNLPQRFIEVKQKIEHFRKANMTEGGNERDVPPEQMAMIAHKLIEIINRTAPNDRIYVNCCLMGKKLLSEERAEMHWKKQGFLKNPEEEITLEVNVSHSEYARVFKDSATPLGGVNLQQEQMELLRTAGGSDRVAIEHHPHGKLDLLRLPSTSEVLTEQYKNWGSKNILTARCAYARLRTPERSSVDHVVDFVGRGQADAKLASVINSNEWKSPSHVESNDASCAMLSEATEIFLRRVLTAGIVRAQSSIDIDGIRFYMMQKLAKSQPPLGMILGKDVDKQVLLARRTMYKAYLMQEERIAKLRLSHSITKTGKEKINNMDPKSRETRKISDMSVLSKRPYIEGEVERVKGLIKQLDARIRRGNPAPFDLPPKDGKIRITDRDIIDGAEAVQQAVGKGTVPSLSSALGGYRGRFSN